MAEIQRRVPSYRVIVFKATNAIGHDGLTTKYGKGCAPLVPVLLVNNRDVNELTTVVEKNDSRHYIGTVVAFNGK